MVERQDVKRLLKAKSYGLLVLAIAANQGAGRAVVIELGFPPALQLRDDALRQHLAQLDAPLIERIDTPDSALSKDGMLIKSDKLAKSCRRELLRKKGVRRAIALEYAMRDEPVWSS